MSIKSHKSGCADEQQNRTPPDVFMASDLGTFAVSHRSCMHPIRDDATLDQALSGKEGIEP